MSEILLRKKKVRAAHRGSVTRILTQVRESLDSTEELNSTRLRQWKQSLSGKLDVLSKLDEELIELVPEEELDNEVDQADKIREKIQLAIIDIDRALKKCTTRSPSPEVVAPMGDETHDTRTGRATDSPLEEPPTPTITDAGDTPPTGTSTTEDETTAAVDSTSPTESTVIIPTPHVKLPKLSLRKFNGDITKWASFWDSFDSAIHSNPILSSVDKFNYLNSFLESTAAESIAGLNLTAKNYEEAIAILKRRFGNTQLIVNRHMNTLLSLAAVTSQYDLKGLRRLCDAVETHVRGLRALGVPAESYGGLLTSILMNKLPPEIRLIISRELTEERWDIERIMKIVNQETDARERSSTPYSSSSSTKRPYQRGTPTAAALMTSNSSSTRCVYCDQNHPSTSCSVMTDVNARKEVLRRSGRCFVCTRKYHISKQCRSTTNCSKCRGRHHVSICPNSQSPPRPGVDLTTSKVTDGSTQTSRDTQSSTSSMYVDSQTPVLLQTAKLQLYNWSEPWNSASSVRARAILDSGSQRTYVSSRLRNQLQLPTRRTESLKIKTFGSTESQDQQYEVVELGLKLKNGDDLKLVALVVPFICNPLTAQPVSHSKNHYCHLRGLDLADSTDIDDVLDVDVLIGSDSYWTLVTGKVLRGTNGPMAIHSKVGWILSGPVDKQETTVSLTFNSTHALRIDNCPMCTDSDQNMESHLRKFWELESLGIMKEEPSVYEKFTQQISFDGQRYQVCLPWRENHPSLPSNYTLCTKRLTSLLGRLRQNPTLLAEYDSIIKAQLQKGIVEVVADPSSSTSGCTHYLPHHGVIRQDRSTSKLRIVYDASARTTGPSLNDCLYTGPKSGQSIFDILLRFRLHQVALAGDIEKAFLMVSVKEEDRDSLRFLWVRDYQDEDSELLPLRFTRVVFGVSSSPFLLNATIAHHMGTYQDVDPSFVKTFLSSIYVDDVSLGTNDVDSTYELYLKSKLRLAEAGFRLRKFVTNSDELRCRVSINEKLSEDQGEDKTSSAKEEDLSYAKNSLGVKLVESQSQHKILGIQWDYERDDFVFDISHVSHLMIKSEPTKRNVVSMATRFFDPLGIVSPVTVQFKILFQQLCVAKVDWDEPLTGRLLEQWNQLISTLRRPDPLRIPRCYFGDFAGPVKSARLIGFCDASLKAYAAVVYLKLEGDTLTTVKLIAAKTRVSPLGKITIPRLELLSALLLSKLIVSVGVALESEISLDPAICYTDSQVSLYWIQGSHQEWKQFVENRIRSIHALVPPEYWRHCPGKQNPADMPSRGVHPTDLTRSGVWLNGPDWLCVPHDTLQETGPVTVIPEECDRERRHRNITHSLISTQIDGPCIGQIIDCEKFNSLNKLLRVTALVLKFIILLCQKGETTPESSPVSHHITTEDIKQAKIYWIRESQAQLTQDGKFPSWKVQLGLYINEVQLWRCGGRMSNAELSPAAQNPILLDKKHHLTTLIVEDAHRRVMHNGVKETLVELRSVYWVIRGRQFVRKTIHRCVTCRRLEGKPYQCAPSPPLPDFRVNQSRPFQCTGVDFAGPLYVKHSATSEKTKVWLCLFTCCATRAVHLDLVPDLHAATFIRCFRRFSARRGIPTKVISDNGRTFKSASKIIRNLLSDPDVTRHFADISAAVDWRFNLEKAPWQGGIFKRMIQSTKRCLKKIVGRASLTYDELSTFVIETEAVLNSRPLSYVAVDDLDPPLTPSHLLSGYRILSLPDPSLSDDPDYETSTSSLTRRMRHFMKTSRYFWKRWRQEYLLGLREFHQACQANKINCPVKEGEIVVIHDENSPRGFWRLGKIESVVRGGDGEIRGACVRVLSKTGRSTVLRRPIQRLYPLEVRPQESVSSHEVQPHPEAAPDSPNRDTVPINTQRSRRQAATHARDRILGCLTD